MAESANTSYSVLGTIAATHGDIALSGNALSIKGCPGAMDLRNLQFVQDYKVTVAEVLQITTCTPTAAQNNTQFSLQITQFVPTNLGFLGDGQNVIHNLSFLSDASMTVTEVCNAFRTQLAQITDLKITATGTTTLILTAQTGAPIFTVVSTGVGLWTSITTSPAGVNAVGTYAALTQELVPSGGTNPFTSGKTYSTFTFQYRPVGNNLTGGDANSTWMKHTLYVQDDATNYGNFVIFLVNILAKYGNTAVEPENLGTQMFSTAGAVVLDLKMLAANIITTGAATATLADGVLGQYKIITLDIDGGDEVVTPATPNGFATITLDTAGDSILLQWASTAGWVIRANFGCVIA